jgi:hypothetical protein
MAPAKEIEAIMKNALVVMSVVLAASVASAQDTKKPVETPKAPAHAAKATHEASKPVITAKATEIAGEVVAADVAKKTLTFKNEKGESLTWPAEGKALASLQSAKAGEKVTVVYRANEKGEPQAATEIKPVPAAKLSDAKAPVAEAKPVVAEKK